MAKKKKKLTPEEAEEANARLCTSDEDKQKAAKWFARASELGEKRQFDYAIEYYANGLDFWPDAVEEACKPLHGCGVARRQLGGKKPGLKDSMKRSMTDKNARQALVNAMWLFGHDPDNVNYIEGIVKAAVRLHAESAAEWAAGVLHKAIDANPKTAGKRYASLVSHLEEMGDRAGERGDSGFGISTYQLAIDVLNSWRRRHQSDGRTIDDLLRLLSTKLTILRGKYKDGDSYRDSMADSEGQADLHDQQRSVQSDDRLAELIEKAEEAYGGVSGDPTKLKSLVDLLRRREDEQDERRAIGLLVEQYKAGKDYRWKHMADDIRMKQLGRQARDLVKADDPEAKKAHYVRQLRYELSVFKERAGRYPTDNRVKYEFGARLFRAGQFEEAIPMMQAARADPKNRAACGMYLGRCFFKQAYFSQAAVTLQEAADSHEFPDDDLGKTILYWLARALEADNETEAARKAFGKILRLDYNYRDVRDRLTALRQVDAKPSIGTSKDGE